MLKLFEVQGFKNFKDKITFDFSNVRDYKFNTECISNGLLGKTIIYGKNSVGKTNLGLAMFDIVSHLTSNNISPNLYEDYTYIGSDLSCFQNGTQFHYVFSFDNEIIDYFYNKNYSRDLVYERLELNNTLIFDYNYTNKKGDFKNLEELAPTLNLSMRGVDSVLRYVINNTVLPDNHPLRQMVQFVSRMLWFVGSNQNYFVGYKTHSKDYFEFIFEDDNLHEFENLLHEAGVKGDLISAEENDGKKRLYFMFNILENKVAEDQIGTKDNDKGKNLVALLPFLSTASSGTRALYNFFYWYKTASDVSLMFIDEFDAYYHYELSETIVKILEKMSNTQVILTSHNTNLLSNRIMRPDCFFIMTENGLTSFANATDRELREGHNLEKLYMSGEFDGEK